MPVASNDATTQSLPHVNHCGNSDNAGDLTEADISVDFTTEIRWFKDGQLPPEVATWFAPADVECLIEHRRDNYHIELRSDVGVKRRFGSKLELKVREEDPEPISLDGGFVGRLERWKRWSPADALVGLVPDDGWIDTEKTIIKRRFDASGEQVDLTHANRAMCGMGCDLEIVAVEIGSRPFWSLAFAAFGPEDRHVESIRAAWHSQCLDRPWPLPSPLVSDDSCGYPEWLVSVNLD